MIRKELVYVPLPTDDEELIKKESLELAQNFERKSVPKFLVAGQEPSSRSVAAWSAIIDAELKK